MIRLNHGLYKIIYTATNSKNQCVTTVQRDLLVQNYPPIITYTYNGSDNNKLINNEEYAHTLIINFDGTGYIKNWEEGDVITDEVTADNGELIISGNNNVTDGKYKMTAKLDDGASTTVVFTVDSKPPEIIANTTTGQVVMNSDMYTYVGLISITFDTSIEYPEAYLVKDDEIIGQTVDEILSYQFEKGIYVIHLKDNKGRLTEFEFRVR